MAEQTQGAPAAPASAKKSKLIFLVLGLVLLLAASGAAWFLLARGKSRPTAETPTKQEPEFTQRLDSFTVNLNDQEESHFLRVTMELGLAHAPKGDSAAKEGAESASFPVARTRDTILSVLTAAKADELLTPDGKAALKHNLLTALQQRVPEIEARDVYFTEFLVQR